MIIVFVSSFLASKNLEYHQQLLYPSYHQLYRLVLLLASAILALN